MMGLPGARNEEAPTNGKHCQKQIKEKYPEPSSFLILSLLPGPISQSTHSLI